MTTASTPSRPSATSIALLILASLFAKGAGEPGGLSTAPRRALLARPFGTGKRCQNSMAGRWLSADDQGMVCRIEDVDSPSGCCSKGDLHSCQTCLMEDMCCIEYEHCVSCCMRKDHTTESDVKNAYRSFSRPETGHWGSVFELCRGKCRTTKLSTVHENSYLGRRHHCFGDRFKPLWTVAGRVADFHAGGAQLEPQQAASAEVSIVAANGPNQNCQQVCASQHKTCSAQHFHLVNHCDRLRDHFDCEAGCQVDTNANRGLDHPAYVIYQSAKDAYPTMCFVNGIGNASCEARHPKTRRLCPCV